MRNAVKIACLKLLCRRIVMGSIGGVLVGLFILFLVVAVVARTIYAAIIRGPQRKLAEQKAAAQGFVPSNQAELQEVLGPWFEEFRIPRSGFENRFQDV